MNTDKRRIEGEIKHKWPEDKLFCSICGVNRLYWNTRAGTTWCIEKPNEVSTKEKRDVKVDI